LVRIASGETESPQVAGFVQSVRVVGIEQIAQKFGVFDQRMFCIGKIHSIKVPQIAASRWSGPARIRP
jgi:hypothetical protein